jgi:DNA-binding response OmpR family regulator
MRVLLIDDMKAVASMVEDALIDDGFVVDVAGSQEEATAAAGCAQYDVVLLDRRLPDGDGLNWLRARRRGGFACPAIIMTGMADVNDRIEGLNGGADDYVAKPFIIAELIARIRAILRRPPCIQDTRLRVGNLEFDTASRQVWIDGSEIRIPRRDLCLLEVLIRRFERVVTRGALEQSLYSFNDEVSSNAIEVGVYRLRAHLAEAGASVRVRTARGVGYVLELSRREAKENTEAGNVADRQIRRRSAASRGLIDTGAG